VALKNLELPLFGDFFLKNSKFYLDAEITVLFGFFKNVYFLLGLKCKECKFRCHRDCELHVPPSCGLPEDLVTFYMNQLSKEGSPILPRLPPSASMSMSASTGVSSIGGDHAFMSRFGGGSSLGGHNPSLHIPAYPDSSSNTSSCNSSTPSSPAVMVTSHPTPPHSASVYHSTRTKFTFPDPPSSMTCFGQKQDSAAASAAAVAYAANNHNKASSPNPVVDSVKSYDSDKTLSGKYFQNA
jgi:kinase suppressor of Ras 2